jgi:hypothetical protein
MAHQTAGDRGGTEAIRTRLLIVSRALFGEGSGGDDGRAHRDHPGAPAHRGFSVAYSLATALFGGFTSAISTFLIEVTGNRAVACLWLMFAAACGLAAALLAWRPGFAERQVPMAAMGT